MDTLIEAAAAVEVMAFLFIEFWAWIQRTSEPYPFDDHES